MESSSAAGRPAPGRGASDLSSSLESFGSEPAAAVGGKQLHNLRRQQARTKRVVESSATTNTTSTSDEEWSPTGSGGRKKAQTKKRGGARKGGGGGKAKKAGRVDSSEAGEDIIGSDGMLVISRPHDHDVLSGRGGGKQRKDIY